MYVLKTPLFYRPTNLLRRKTKFKFLATKCFNQNGYLIDDYRENLKKLNKKNYALSSTIRNNLNLF